METGYDILRAWISRMLMLCIYKAKPERKTIAQSAPFKTIVLHGMVNDPYGKKMSKSRGNVVRPLEVTNAYGADSVRMGLVYGTGLGNDQSMSYAKLEAMRKFANKLWNIGRFIEMKRNEIFQGEAPAYTGYFALSILDEEDKKWKKEVDRLGVEITKYLDNYQFNLAAERLYEFIWHRFADCYIEEVKNRISKDSFLCLLYFYIVQLKLLHPFMPFITEEIYQKLSGKSGSIMIELWPELQNSSA
jgi:valyl-tRNA synthetase